MSVIQEEAQAEASFEGHDETSNKRKREKEEGDICHEEIEEKNVLKLIERHLKKHKKGEEPFPYPSLTEKESKKVRKLLEDDKNFICCISRALIENPVSLDEYPEKVYDRDSLISWLKWQSIEPSTGKELKNKSYHSNHFAKAVLDGYKEKIIKKASKLINTFMKENRADDVTLKLIDRCLLLNKSSQLPSRSIKLLKDKLTIYTLQGKPLSEQLKIKVQIGEVYYEMNSIAQCISILEEILIALNTYPQLFLSNNDSNDLEADAKKDDTIHLGDTSGLQKHFSAFLNTCYDILQEEDNIRDLNLLSLIAEYFKKSNDLKKVCKLNEMIVNRKNSVKSVKDYQIVENAFKRLITHYQSTKYLDKVHASTLIIKYIKWLKKPEIEKWAANVESEQGKEIHTDLLYKSKKRELFQKLKNAIELDNLNLKAYRLFLSLCAEEKTKEQNDCIISETSLLMLNHLVDAVSDLIPNRGLRILPVKPKSEIEIFEKLLEVYTNKRQEQIIELMISENEDTESFETTFKLCGFKWRIIYHPKFSKNNDLDYAACFLRCLTEFNFPHTLEMECEMRVLEPEENDQNLEQLFLVPLQTFSFSLNCSESKIENGQTDTIQSDIIGKYSNQNKLHILVGMVLKSGTMDL